MSLNVREVVEHLYGYLRKEQRALPLVDADLEDPLPAALVAINATLQRLAVLAPKFAVQRPMGVVFHAPKEVAVTGLTREGRQVTCAAWPAWAAGCALRLPGEAAVNRILEVRGTVAELVRPYLGSATGGMAMVLADCVTLPPEVLTVLPPVRLGEGVVLRPAGGRRGLAKYASGLGLGRSGVAGDFGRRGGAGSPEGGVYAVDCVLAAGAALPRLQLRLAGPVAEDVVVEFDARCCLGPVTGEQVLGVNPPPVPVPGEHVESVFLPLALLRFFSASVMRNTDAPAFVTAQAEEAERLLKGMRPQTEGSFKFYPGL